MLKDQKIKESIFAKHGDERLMFHHEVQPIEMQRR